MPRPGRHGPPLYPAYLVGVNIWNNLVFGNLGRWCTNQQFKDPNSSSYWPPWQLFHLLQSGDSFTSCSLLDSVSTPLEAIWQRGASSPWPFSPCATQKQWQTWFHSLTKSIFTWAFEQKALKLSERIGGKLGSMAGQVVLLIKIEVVLWPFLSTVFVSKTTSVQYLQQFMLCVHWALSVIDINKIFTSVNNPL